jgi:putative phosphoesterase
MRIGLISDVHSDLKALLRAIRLLNERHAVDLIWCAGDLVGRGQYPNEVVTRIVHGGIPAVLGNHDEMLLAMQGTSLVRENYQAETLQMLANLPRTYRTQIDGRKVVMVHGTPRSNAESLPLMPAQQRGALAWLKKIDAHILITGHTHVPMFAQDQRGLVVNPGSLFDPAGSQRSSSETYGVLDVSGLHFAYFPLWD